MDLRRFAWVDEAAGPAAADPGGTRHRQQRGGSPGSLRATANARTTRRLERFARGSSDCDPRGLSGVDRREGQVVDALHTFDMAQALDEAGRQEDDGEIALGVDHPCR